MERRGLDSGVGWLGLGRVRSLFLVLSGVVHVQACTDGPVRLRSYSMCSAGGRLGGLRPASGRPWRGRLVGWDGHDAVRMPDVILPS